MTEQDWYFKGQCAFLRAKNSRNLWHMADYGMDGELAIKAFLPPSHDSNVSAANRKRWIDGWNHQLARAGIPLENGAQGPRRT